MEILTITETRNVVITTTQHKKTESFDIGKIKVALLPPIAKRELTAELTQAGFDGFMIHTAMKCRLEDLKPYINVWKYVAYMLAVELLERN